MTFTALLGTVQLRETILSRAENVFTKILLCSKYDFDQENFSYGLKKSLPNQDLANGQVRPGFDSRKISHMNIHSRSDLKYIIFNTGTQSVLGL